MKNNETTITEKITVNVSELAQMLSCGKQCAEMIGQNADAIIRIGKLKLYKVDKIKEYIAKTSNIVGSTTYIKEKYNYK